MDKIQARLMAQDMWGDGKIEERYGAANAFLKERYSDFRAILERHESGELSDTEMNGALGQILENSPVWVYSFRLSVTREEAKYLTIRFNEDQQVALDILEYRNLVRKQECMEFGRGTKLLTLGWFDLTNLRLDF